MLTHQRAHLRTQRREAAPRTATLLPHAHRPPAQRRGPLTVAALPTAEEAKAPVDNAPVQPQQPAEAQAPPATPAPDTLQAKAAAFLQTLSKHRRAITVAVAILDVAFIWLAIKGVRFFWDEWH